MAALEENFRNVFISDGGRGITVYNRTIDGDRGSKLGTFVHDEYDVHISFKRKPRPIVANDHVFVEGELGSYRVLASLYSGVDAWAWLIKDPVSSASPRTVNTSRLRLANDSM